MKQGATALHWSAAKGREELAKLLLDHGADVNAVDELDGCQLFLLRQMILSPWSNCLLSVGQKTK